MAALIIEQPHALGRETARRAADDAAHRLGMRSQWEGDALRFEGKGASGTIAVSDRSVRVEVTLGLMLRPFRGRIEREIREGLETALG